MSLQFIHGGFHHGFLLALGLLVQEQAFFKERGAIHDNVRFSHKFLHIPLVDVLSHAMEFQSRVEITEPLLDRFDTRFPKACVGHQELPVEIAGFHIPAVSQDQSADSSRGQFQRHHRTQAPYSGDEHAGALQFALTLFTVSGNGQLPRVHIQLLGAQRWKIAVLQVHPPAIGAISTRVAPSERDGSVPMGT